jgi:hypothetical protein
MDEDEDETDEEGDEVFEWVMMVIGIGSQQGALGLGLVVELEEVKRKSGHGLK